MPDCFNVATLEGFDAVDGKQIEDLRRSLSLSTGDFAEHLGWSKRKYQRMLEAAEEEGTVARDVALATYGLASFLSRSGVAAHQGVSISHLEGVPSLFANIAGDDQSWTVRIAPFLMRAIIQKAKTGLVTTYGAEAERLEDAGRTHRVWPRTVYAHPLGLICEVCMDLKQVGGKRVPLLTAIVISQTGEPGAGIDSMVRKYFRRHLGDGYLEAWKDFKRDRAEGVRKLQQEVFDFGDWDKVAAAVGI